MSLPLAYAPFENTDIMDNTDIEKKKSSKNKTLKKQSKPHVAAIIDKIHENTTDASKESQSDMVDFSPPPPPKSAGDERLALRANEDATTGDDALRPKRSVISKAPKWKTIIVTMFPISPR